MNAVRLNIPKKLLSDIKNDRCRSELIALSICIKCSNPDSLMKNVSATKIQYTLHCGFNKAKSILSAAKANKDLFTYNEYTNSLLAKNLKVKYTDKVTDKKGRYIWQMYAVKFEVKDYSLRELLKKFKTSLMLCAVNYENRRDKFICKGNTTLFTPVRKLTQGRIAKIVGAKNRTYVYRMTKDMEKKGLIKMYDSSIRLVECCTQERASELCKVKSNLYVYDSYNKFLYEVTPKSYEINSRDVEESFKNIIFNHSVRLTGNKEYVPTSKYDEYYEIMEH